MSWEPVLSAGPVALKKAAVDREQMRKLVGSYAAARPKASTAQTIEALSTGYAGPWRMSICRSRG